MAPSEGKRLLCLGKQLNYVWSVSELDKKKKLRSKKIAGIRGWIQAAATLLTNPHIPNFFQGKIYQGKAKTVCVPGLNCYSCPAATGACPIGAFQAVVGSSKFKFSYYITGFLILLGVTLGRFICGFLCPFGWFQDLLHKIPGKKFSTARLKPLRYLKYIILVVFVILLPMFATNSIGMGDPFFCKYICPQGVLEGAIPLSIGNAAIRSALGKLFSFKFCILITVGHVKWISTCAGPQIIRNASDAEPASRPARRMRSTISFWEKRVRKRTPEINSQRSETID